MAASETVKMLNVHFAHVANVWYSVGRNNSDGVRDRVYYRVHDRDRGRDLVRDRVRGRDRVRSRVRSRGRGRVRVRGCNVYQYPEVNDFLLFFGRTDDRGIICDQRGIFRVNCMDCLDRTNVVQAALARHIMEQQVN